MQKILVTLVIALFAVSGLTMKASAAPANATPGCVTRVEYKAMNALIGTKHARPALAELLGVHGTRDDHGQLQWYPLCGLPKDRAAALGWFDKSGVLVGKMTYRAESRKGDGYVSLRKWQ